jgi:hypothetical protein
MVVVSFVYFLYTRALPFSHNKLLFIKIKIKKMPNKSMIQRKKCISKLLE